MFDVVDEGLETLAPTFDGERETIADCATAECEREMFELTFEGDRETAAD